MVPNNQNTPVINGNCQLLCQGVKAENRTAEYSIHDSPNTIIITIKYDKKAIKKTSQIKCKHTELIHAPLKPLKQLYDSNLLVLSSQPCN